MSSRLLRLPAPPPRYDAQDQAELRRALEDYARTTPAANAYTPDEVDALLAALPLPRTVVLSADEAGRTSIILTDTGLTFAVEAGERYRFEFLLAFSSSSATNGIRLSLTIPSATVFSAAALVPEAADGTAGERQGWITADSDPVIGSGVPASSTTFVARIQGILVPSASGDLTVVVGTEDGIATITVKQGSCGFLWTL